jgi:RNA polymerase sigma factor (sigma-70 family)
VDATDIVIQRLLEEFGSDEADRAWRSFLTAYSDLIYGVIRTFTRDADDAGDCFLFVCEKLSDKKYRRLRAFTPNGPARFSTWLRAVVRNLCLDWHRARFGRPQLFRSVAALGVIEQQIFTLLFHRRLSTQEAWGEFERVCPGVAYDEFESKAEKLRGLLTSRQLWLLSTANTTHESLAGLQETHLAVGKALESLHSSERLLLRLRFSEGLALQQIAKLVGLKDAQTADRRIRNALELVRQELGLPKFLAGKPGPASV